MRVIIAGAGAVGRSIARELSRSDHQVTIIDKAKSAMKVTSVPDADWILGDACDPSTLDEAGIAACDTIVAATGDDKANLVVSMLSKHMHGVPRVIARVNNPRNEWLFDSSWGIDVPVSTPRIITALVEEAVSEGKLLPITTFHSGGALYHTYVPDYAPVTGVPIGDILLPPGATITAIVRDGQPLPAERDQSIEGSDEVFLLVSEDAAEDLDLLSELFGTTGAVTPEVPGTGGAGEHSAESADDETDVGDELPGRS